MALIKEGSSPTCAGSRDIFIMQYCSFKNVFIIIFDQYIFYYFIIIQIFKYCKLFFILQAESNSISALVGFSWQHWRCPACCQRHIHTDLRPAKHSRPGHPAVCWAQINQLAVTQDHVLLWPDPHPLVLRPNMHSIRTTGRRGALPCPSLKDLLYIQNCFLPRLTMLEITNAFFCYLMF